ncbi:SH3 domain-containing protein [Roseomonas haemaphysalidis]|uniref:SH3 domain-containing protein n=1 Tax=Roseomonas haemaphysalidis TaxID=2768162 RepID=A0ABS3KU74_9PROT|nr:SH3 domain-containing protein [Roseomonas haemaphysalidis]MBO1081029.1 SH3 domain-containing protein [Roseomonas haemaphysalidis]
MMFKPMIRFAPMAVLGLLAAAPLLAGCDDAAAGKAEAAQADLAARTAEARKAVEDRLRNDLRGALAFRDVTGHTQAVADTMAICGQLTLNGGPATPFVALVSRQADGAMAVEPHVAIDDVSATRVFVETQSRCVADAAAMPAQRRGAPPPLPVIPARLNTITPDAPPAVKRMEAEAAQAQQNFGGVTLRQNGNMRENPHGGGAVIRVLARGTAMRVFAEAPGGWLQVGQQQAEGWVHNSMVIRGVAPADDAQRLATASR